MIEKIRLFFSPKKSVNFKDWMDLFFKEDCHYWIISNKYIRSNIEDLFERLTPGQRIFFSQRNLSLVQSTGRFASAIRANERVIVIYPELSHFLTSVTTEISGPFLANELGHFYYKHSEQIIDPLQAQVEADDFAFNLGYGKDLISFLEGMPHSEEMLIRLTYLTAKYFSNESA